MVDSATLHRGAKYFMDSGRAATHEEAMALLQSFGLTIHVGAAIATSRDEQVALLTLVNAARRSFLAGVAVVGLPDAKPVTRLTRAETLAQAVKELGGRVVKRPRRAWPAAVIGDVPWPVVNRPVWRLAWSGWRGGVAPARDGDGNPAEAAMPLAPVLAAACCAAEAFAFHAKDHVMAGHRPLGMSIWNPSADWLADDPSEPKLAWLPSQLWLIGLGNLGQAFAWALTALPYAEPKDVKLVLQDDDRVAKSNDSTSLLSFIKDVGQRKARRVGAWLDARGFDTYLLENRFGTWTTRTPEEPAVALCGVDNPIARAALECPGFGLVVEAGLGAGPEAFRSMSLHSFPGSERAEDIWGKNAGPVTGNVEHLPAYQAMKDEGADACGLTQLASRTVGVPFVGLTAGVMVIAELLRRLNGGTALELIAGSALALEAMEIVTVAAQPYAFGHVAAA
ncbi:MAG TPA: hypothetical protein VMR17_19560 [Xanthobacteraceae bacterium]|nr:hypothetical protein [Xanthobacteraceae bacterium]